MKQLEHRTKQHHYDAFRSSVSCCAARLAVALLIVLLASPASAQYFGRNKVRYRALDFQVMATEHFDIYFYASEREGVEIAARLAERWYARLAQLFNHRLSGRQPLVLYASHSDFEQTNIAAGELTEATGGITEPLRRRIVLPLAGRIADSDHIIGHELVHAFQFDIATPSGGLGGGGDLAHMPLWFVEGMAEYLSLGGVDAHAAMKVRDAVSRNELPSILDLRKPKYFPYQWGHAVFAYIASQYGDQAVPQLFRYAMLFGVESAIETALGVSAQELSNAWHAATLQLYDPVLSASVPFQGARRLNITGDLPGMSLNFAPSLSPDGRWVAYFSTRGYSSPDLYVADANTGRVVRRLTKTATDSRYTSIQYVNSSATWDPASERVAIAAIVAGRAALAILNAGTGRWDRDIVMSGIDEIRNPSWAPDGGAIAFSGMRQGVIDLFVYDLHGGTVRQLTSDAYADLHPAWSPDSRRVAFVTDRFSSELDALHMGALRVAIADVETGLLESVTAFGTGKHVNPQWSRDGESLLFIAEPDGVPNVYRLSLSSRRIEQITATGVGVSGITPSSPALSVSTRSERLAVSAFESDRYTIYVWDAAVPTPASGTWAGDAAALAPSDRTPADRSGLFGAADPSPPSAHPYPTTPYEATLSRVGQGQSAAAAVGVGGPGTGAAGGAGFAFSDMLNDRLLVTAVQVGTPVSERFSVNDLAFDVGYLRQDGRWTWAIVGGQMPYLTGVRESGRVAEPDGEGRQVSRQTIARETRRTGSLILWYPFNRARRLELAAGVVHTTREQIVASARYSADTGELLSSNLETQPRGQPLNVASAAAALVLDTAAFGPVSPIQGQRARLEIAPAFGSTEFTSVLVDYRRYVMPVAFYTIAARVIHYGRYGNGAEDARLQPLYLNDPRLVRGYGRPTYGATDCVAMPADACYSSDLLAGSRVLVGNVELRFPLLRPFGVAAGMYGPMPVEVALFGDTGVAWSGADLPAIVSQSRTRIASVGLTFRMGLGFAAFQFDVTRPLRNPEDRWTLGFNVMPGW